MNDGMRGNHNAKRNKKVVRLKCNGPSCRGKFFRSISRKKRFCSKCRGLMKNLLDVYTVSL